jgi:hypothetical protein
MASFLPSLATLPTALALKEKDWQSGDAKNSEFNL